MKNSEKKNVVYEYRYANLSEGMRHTLRENRVSLFERNRNKWSSIKNSNRTDTFYAKAGVLVAIVLIGLILSLIV